MKVIRARVFHVHGEEQVTGEGSAAEAGSQLQQRPERRECSELFTAAQSCPCAHSPALSLSCLSKTRPGLTFM